MERPLVKGLIFAAFVLGFYLAGWLTYTQAGTIGGVGFFILTTLFYWRAVFPQRLGITLLLVTMVVAFFLFASFQMALRDIFGVAQDNVVVIEAIFNTDSAESTEFVAQYWRYIVKHLVVFMVATTLYLWLTLRRRAPVPRGGATVAACCIFTVLTLLLHLNPTVRRYNPLLYFPVYYAIWKHDLETTERLMAMLDETMALDDEAAIYAGGKRNTVVWVIGESDTRHNWSLYGYPRETTPRLAAHPELLHFTDVRAADAGTVTSLTKMLTPATQQAPDLWKSRPSVLALARAAGYKVFWITNHGTDRRGVVAVFSRQADVAEYLNRGTSRGESSFDEVVLEPYARALADPAPRKFIIVHLMGAHPAYDFRYPKAWERYTLATDDVVTRRLTEQGRALHAIAQRNFYDNAISYQDHVLATLLEKAQRADGPLAWLYIADHGEDVAHHSNFAGHNHRVAEMWDVPMLFWASDDYPVDVPPPSLHYQADVIDHALLGLLRITGRYHDLALDPFSGDARFAATKAPAPPSLP